MSIKEPKKKADRYLMFRDGNFHYMRRIPLSARPFDNRGRFVRMSLRTSDLAKAMAMRDIHERADNEYWGSLIAGTESEVAQRTYKAAVARATALGFTYRSAADIALHEPVSVIISRIEKAENAPVGSPVKEAAYGMVDAADDTISVALDTYIKTIARAETRYKSEKQKKDWENKKKAAVAIFIEQCTDKRMNDITRDDALKVYNFWLNRIAPETGVPTHTASIGKRHLGDLRGLYRDWYKYLNIKDRKNPFEGLSFSESKALKRKRKRPSFSVDWIAEKFLTKGPLAGMNAEARGVLLATVETGARLSEICNLKQENIVLDVEFPYINIEPSFDPDDPREIKTFSSIRAVPLVGVSLAVMKKHKKGFPRYKDKGSSLSATINKFLRENKLLETPNHKAYSLRHSFEDRMKEGGLDSELRMILMGHAIDRPDYGEGGSIKWRHGELSKIALPFDPEIV